MARKILLADDSVTAQNMGRKILADAGYEVITVNNGSAALKKISEQKPDLIVLDVYMPGYSGLEVCQRLKDVPDTSRIPILLTVGKLEPFKPEEARRARADGFIVKPFEASELLSALSKLEDKVVPRSESSKTGRFARAAAGIDDSRFDKSMAVEEDNGWKSRIVFPKKNIKPVEEEKVEDPAVFAPVHKDTRLAVEPNVGKATAAAAEERVDLGALAPTGLPKDVTPEEIAALAAAAAQVKGKFAEDKTPDPLPEMVVTAPAEAPTAEIKVEAPVAEPMPAAVPVPEIPAPAAPVATFAEQRTPEKVESKEPEPGLPANLAAAMATIANLETEAVETPSSSSGNGDSSPTRPQPQEEPVTMAARAAAYWEPAVSRWTAVAVGLAPEDMGISLEQEMQKACAASAGAESGPLTVRSTATDSAPAPAATVESSSAEIVSSPVAIEAPAPPVAELPTPAEVAPEAAETMSAVANAATDAITAAVAELESVAAAYAGEKATISSAIPASTAETEASTPAPSDPEKVGGTPDVVEAKPEPVPVAETAATTAESVETTAEHANEEKSIEEETASPEQTEAAKSDELLALSEEPAHEESKENAPIVAAYVASTPVESAVVNVPEEHAGANEISEEPAALAQEAFHARGLDDMAKRESDTAAAWASWRKIRETGNSKPKVEASEESEESSPKDAAMAVAVGAEHSPEDAKSFDSDPEIASIVDSVLADMRPKIVEEIARKLGKKK